MFFYSILCLILLFNFQLYRYADIMIFSITIYSFLAETIEYNSNDFTKNECVNTLGIQGIS